MAQSKKLRIQSSQKTVDVLLYEFSEDFRLGQNNLGLGYSGFPSEQEVVQSLVQSGYLKKLCVKGYDPSGGGLITRYAWVLREDFFNRIFPQTHFFRSQLDSKQRIKHSHHQWVVLKQSLFPDGHPLTENLSNTVPLSKVYEANPEYHGQVGLVIRGEKSGGGFEKVTHLRFRFRIRNGVEGIVRRVIPTEVYDPQDTRSSFHERCLDSQSRWIEDDFYFSLEVQPHLRRDPDSDLGGIIFRFENIEHNARLRSVKLFQFDQSSLEGGWSAWMKIENRNSPVLIEIVRGLLSEERIDFDVQGATFTDEGDNLASVLWTPLTSVVRRQIVAPIANPKVIKVYLSDVVLPNGKKKPFAKLISYVIDYVRLDTSQSVQGVVFYRGGQVISSEPYSDVSASEVTQPLGSLLPHSLLVVSSLEEKTRENYQFVFSSENYVSVALGSFVSSHLGLSVNSYSSAFFHFLKKKPSSLPNEGYNYQRLPRPEGFVALTQLSSGEWKAYLQVNELWDEYKNALKGIVVRQHPLLRPYPVQGSETSIPQGYRYPFWVEGFDAQTKQLQVCYYFNEDEMELDVVTDLTGTGFGYFLSDPVLINFGKRDVSSYIQVDFIPLEWDYQLLFRFSSLDSTVPLNVELNQRIREVNHPPECRPSQFNRLVTIEWDETPNCLSGQKTFYINELLPNPKVVSLPRIRVTPLEWGYRAEVYYGDNHPENNWWILPNGVLNPSSFKAQWQTTFGNSAVFSGILLEGKNVVVIDPYEYFLEGTAGNWGNVTVEVSLKVWISEGSAESIDFALSTNYSGSDVVIITE